MARIRSIKPKFWDDEKLGKISRDARLLFIGMWNHADDLGVITSNPVWIKSKIFPYDELDTYQLKNWLKELLDISRIVTGTFHDESYFLIVNFKRHQVINKPNNEDIFIPKDCISTTFGDNTPIPEQSGSNPTPVQGGKERRGEDKERRGEEHAGDFNRINYPFGSDFKKIWGEWKTYKKKQHEFEYKSEGSEQSALHKLTSLCSTEQGCVEIIKQSMANGWKDFYVIKNTPNGTANGHGTLTERVQSKLKDRIASGK